jgi:uroporphyrin-III C-methyltransferase/precorrin-2 dehydrogenase/sirohydrochlorin ferrochelatase
VNYFPIFINLKNKNILVVGAGEVAFNKIKLLLRSGAIINIISQNISSDIQKLLDKRKVKWISKEFNCSYLNKIFLVIAATNNIELNQEIFKSCNDRCIFVNVVDDKSKCSFIFPSIVDRSPIVVAISSGGTAPVLLRLLREKIETILPVRLGVVAEISGNWRSIVKKKFTTLLERRRFWEKLFNSVFVEYIINGELKKAKQILIAMISKSHFLNGEIILVARSREAAAAAAPPAMEAAE